MSGDRRVVATDDAESIATSLRAGRRVEIDGAAGEWRTKVCTAFAQGL